MNFEFLRNPFIFGGLSSLIIIILFYIDSKIIKKKKEKKEYFKIFIFVFITVSLLIYFMNINNLFIDNPIKTIKESKLPEPVLDTGIPDF